MSGAKEGLSEFERAGIQRMVAADESVAHLVLVDVVIAALVGASAAGVHPIAMITALEKISGGLMDSMVKRGEPIAAPITSPRKAV